MPYSSDQATAFDALTEALKRAGINLDSGLVEHDTPDTGTVFAVTGKAGSGKTLLLADLARALEDAGLSVISGDYDNVGKRQRSLAILAPTNKAASVLRRRGVAATTIHRILYRPVYDPEYEQIAEWLIGRAQQPKLEGISPAALQRAETFYKANRSIPGALAAAGLRGSDFITGWKRREDPLDIGFVDEASMLDDRQLSDLRDVFSFLVLFGDPAQLAPVGQSGQMVFDQIGGKKTHHLSRIHRQEAGNPILDLAHALSDESLNFSDFEQMVKDEATRDDRVRISERVSCDLMARSPVLVWRNATRIRLIHAFRTAHGLSLDEFASGEPLICDGLELPMKHRAKRLDLEARGLIKGAQVIYLGAGRKPGFSRLHVLGAPDPMVSAATIIKIEAPNEEEPFIPTAARMGAAFVHGAACTIHKAQGSQWRDVQVFAPDLYVAARAGRSEAGIPLWKRLAYVAITRAEDRLHWVTHYRLQKPTEPLNTDDLRGGARPELILESEDQIHHSERNDQE
ncbi:MAG: AAA family ATPase [Pseudomonadota bacterium]